MKSKMTGRFLAVTLSPLALALAGGAQAEVAHAPVAPASDSTRTVDADAATTEYQLSKDVTLILSSSSSVAVQDPTVCQGYTHCDVYGTTSASSGQAFAAVGVGSAYDEFTA